MGSDNSSPRLQRPRLLPGPLADLKDSLWGLYLDADTPSLDRIRARMDVLDDVAGSGNAAAEIPGKPNRDTIRDVLVGPRLPTRVQSVIAVAAALLHYRATPTELATATVAGHPAIEHVRRQWRQAAKRCARRAADQRAVAAGS